MPPSYQVVLIHKDLRDFAREVEEAIRTAAGDVLLQPNLLDFRHDVSHVSADSQVTVVYLGSTEGSRDGAIRAALRDAVVRSFPVLPVVRNANPVQFARSCRPRSSTLAPQTGMKTPSPHRSCYWGCWG